MALLQMSPNLFIRRLRGPLRLFRWSIEAMVWLNPVWINDVFLFIGGRRCHQMPTMPSRKFYKFFDLSLTAPTASIRSPPPMVAADQILCGLLQDIGARRLYGFPVDVRAIFLPNDDIVVK